MSTTTTLYHFDDLDLNGKRAFIRVDFNVPIEDGKVTDDSRIRAHLPTITAVLGKGAGVILASHLGRPKGKASPEFSLKPVAEPLGALLGKEVKFCDDCVGESAKSMAAALEPGEVLLLENLRFHEEEEANDEAFGKELASLADAYINDAFATAHRAHASTDAAPRAATQKAAGKLLCEEVDYLQKTFSVPQRPLVAIIGGAKISTKIGVLESLVGKVDRLLIGGAMANTFLGALDLEMGSSLVEKDQYQTALEVMEAAIDRDVLVELPRDLVCETSGYQAGSVTVAARYLRKDLSALDIGPHTRARFAELIEDAGTVIWNGPMGMFEKEPYDEGTLYVARAVAHCEGLTLAGGGDTLAALNRLGLSDAIDHLSTGGGAFLEWIEGKSLPGVEALRKG